MCLPDLQNKKKTSLPRLSSFLFYNLTVSTISQLFSSFLNLIIIVLILLKKKKRERKNLMFRSAMDREIAVYPPGNSEELWRGETRSFTHACYILNSALAESVFSPHRRCVLATSGKYTLPPSTRGGCVAVWAGVKGGGVLVQMREEVSLALSGMSSRDYVSQDSINLSTSSLFKGGGDFPSRRCLDEWLVKIRIRFLLFLPPRVHRAPAEHLRRLRSSSHSLFTRWRAG